MDKAELIKELNERVLQLTNEIHDKGGIEKNPFLWGQRKEAVRIGMLLVDLKKS